MKHFILAITLFFTINISAQTWNQMNDTLLRGGFVVSAANQSIFVNDSVTILAGQFGTFRTEDNGYNWESSDNGMSISIGPVAIAKLNNNPYLLVDYNRLYTSSDNGRNWTLTMLAGIPSSPYLDVLFSVNGALYLGGSGSTYKSTDGNNWTLCNTLFSIGSDSLSWNFSSGVLEDAMGATKSIPNLGGSIPSPFSLIMSPHGNYLYCFTGTEIYRYDITTSASAWTLASTFPVSIPAYTGFPPTYPYTYGATDSSLFLTIVTEATTGKRITRMFRSTDQAQTWTQVTSGLDVPVIIGMRQIAPDTVVLNDINGNLLFSFDNGSTWIRRDSHFISHYQQNLIVMDNSLLLKQIKNMGHHSVTGILKSDDNGTTWHNSNNGLSLLPDYEYDSSKLYGNFDFLFKTGNIAFCGREPSYFARSYDEGDNWSSLPLPSAGDMVLWYQGDQNTFFIGEDSAGTLKYFRTNDEGNTWQSISSIAPISSYAPMQILGKNDTLLMLVQGSSSTPGVPKYFMYRSINNGTSWSDISGGFLTSDKELATENGGGYYIPILDFDVTTNKFMIVLTTHDSTSNTTYYSGPTSDSLYYFDGTNWANLNATGLPSGINIHALKFDNGAWDIASDSGMYVSNDGGLSWSSGISAFVTAGNDERSLSSDGFNQSIKIVTLNIKNTNAFVSSSSNGCWRNSVIANQVDEKKINSSIEIYPNPSVDKINLVSNADLKKCSLQIFDITGKLLKQESHDRILAQTVVEIDLSMLSSGVYILKIQSEKGVDQKKIILTQ
ncbi:MAG: T9SS type A sorting domain-containing protein [Bacteroidia bacterium]